MAEQIEQIQQPNLKDYATVYNILKVSLSGGILFGLGKILTFEITENNSSNSIYKFEVVLNGSAYKKRTIKGEVNLSLKDIKAEINEIQDKGDIMRSWKVNICQLPTQAGEEEAVLLVTINGEPNKVLTTSEMPLLNEGLPFQYAAYEVSDLKFKIEPPSRQM